MLPWLRTGGSDRLPEGWEAPDGVLAGVLAPQAGLVKDLATHTAGTVAAPGTILMTLVPREEHLRAEGIAVKLHVPTASVPSP